MPGWRNGRRGGLKNRWGETLVRVQFPGPVRSRKRRRATLHSATQAPDERQGGALQPHSARGMGLRSPLHLKRATNPRLDDLAPHLQPSPSSYQPRSAPAHLTSQQRVWALHLAPTNPAPPGRLDVLARGVETSTNASGELQRPRRVADDARRGEGHDQPTPRLGVVAVEHLLGVSSEHLAEPHELARTPVRSGVKDGSFPRGRRSLPFRHSLRGYRRVPAHGQPICPRARLRARVHVARGVDPGTDVGGRVRRGLRHPRDGLGSPVRARATRGGLRCGQGSRGLPRLRRKRGGQDAVLRALSEGTNSYSRRHTTTRRKRLTCVWIPPRTRSSAIGLRSR
jgi:hypothetical protein